MHPITPFVFTLIALLLFSAPPDHVVGHHVQFSAKAGVLRPFLPVEFRVEQESGGRAEGTVDCDVAARNHIVMADGTEKTESETVLRCGGRVFVVKQILFTESR